MSWHCNRMSRSIALLIIPFMSSVSFAQRPQPNRPAPAPRSTPGNSTAAASTPARYKGIWEPVSYPDDVQFYDVFFVTADEGWVAGGAGAISGGLIIHTTDAGNHWEAQYGDPQSSDRAIKELRFLDQTHGWAVQGTGSTSRLLHTRDGKLWTVAGTIDEHTTDYAFTSEANGVQLSKDVIKITNNGGRSWTPVFPCAAKVQVAGLWKNMTCEWTRLQFVTPDVAYAIGKPNATSNEERGVLFLAKSTDGGATWTLTTQELTDYPEDVFFIDTNIGYVRTGYADTGQLYKTTDGGQTWTGMAASPGNRLQFADPEVGWALHYRKVSFTTDGGTRWNSREYSFPVSGNAFSLPRRDRGYVVGDHGMIYRYSIVPETYMAKGMIPAPLLSGIDSPLDIYVQNLTAQVNKLSADTGLPPVSVTPGSPDGSTISAGANSGQTMSRAGAGTSAPPSGTTFAQNTSPAAASGAPQNADAGATSASFTQSTETGSAAGVAGNAFLQDMGQAQTTLNSVATEAPVFATKYRNLNLMLAGFQVSTQMPVQIQGLQQSFRALKNIKDPQAATAAMQDVQTKVTGLVQMVRLAFLKR